MTSRDYLFVVDGELSDGVAGAFEGMRLHRNNGTTTIEGPCRDQAELLGTLSRICDLGLTLLSFFSKDSGGLPFADRPPATRSVVMAGPKDAIPSRPSAVEASRDRSHGPQA